MTISPSKDCWSRYDIDANFRVLAEWLGPDFPRAMTFPEFSGSVARRNIVPLEISNLGVVDPRQSRRQPARSPPINWMFSFCSYGHRSVRRECLATFEKIRGRDHSLG